MYLITKNNSNEIEVQHIHHSRFSVYINIIMKVGQGKL